MTATSRGSRRRPGSTRVLTASYRPVEGFRLADGRFTSMRSVAEHEIYVVDRGAVTQALLRLPVEPPRSATPARSEFVRQLVRDGRLPEPVGEHFLRLGGITDTVWEVLRPFVQAAEGLRRDTRPCWEVTLANVSGHRFELPVPYDAAEHQHPGEPPLSALAEILAALAGQGWHPGLDARAPWGANPPRDEDPAAGAAPSAIQIELFRRRIRPSGDPRPDRQGGRG